MSLKKNGTSLPYIFGSPETEKGILRPKLTLSSSLENFFIMESLTLNSGIYEKKTSKKELNRILEPTKIKNEKISLTKSKTDKKFINIPDFYIGPSLKKANPQYPLSEILEKYRNAIKSVNKIDSKNIPLSKETYFSDYEQDIINSLQPSVRKSSWENTVGNNFI